MADPLEHLASVLRQVATRPHVDSNALESSVRAHAMAVARLTRSPVTITTGTEGVRATFSGRNRRVAGKLLRKRLDADRAAIAAAATVTTRRELGG